ncbi:response regulator [Dongia sedimenti]|uniref:Response regulator n=1 Tax=Dongia sedimenti TaxID=3064282 RepID=A0ABU0YKV4_9PROT|nr:response regulator [Rhodospirillaceae bacterium R-7]
MDADLPSATDAGQDRRPLVLIIDDDPAMRDSLAAVIEAFGFRTHTAVNGLEGLEAVATVAPAAIITDIHMPDMDGLELLTALRNASTGIPVIAISGGVAKGFDFLSAARKMGAVAAFQKPLPVFEMIDTISRLMTRGVAA